MKIQYMHQILVLISLVTACSCQCPSAIVINEAPTEGGDLFAARLTFAISFNCQWTATSNPFIDSSFTKILSDIHKDRPWFTRVKILELVNSNGKTLVVYQVDGNVSPKDIEAAGKVIQAEVTSSKVFANSIGQNIYASGVVSLAYDIETRPPKWVDVGRTCYYLTAAESCGKPEDGKCLSDDKDQPICSCLTEDVGMNEYCQGTDPLQIAGIVFLVLVLLVIFIIIYLVVCRGRCCPVAYYAENIERELGSDRRHLSMISDDMIKVKGSPRNSRVYLTETGQVLPRTRDQSPKRALYPMVPAPASDDSLKYRPSPASSTTRLIPEQKADDLPPPPNIPVPPPPPQIINHPYLNNMSVTPSTVLVPPPQSARLHTGMTAPKSAISKLSSSTYVVKPFGSGVYNWLKKK